MNLIDNFHVKVMMLVARYQHYSVGEVRHLLKVPDDPITLSVHFISNKGESEAVFEPLMDAYVFDSLHRHVEGLIEQKRIEKREREQAQKLWNDLTPDQRKLLQKHFLTRREIS